MVKDLKRIIRYGDHRFAAYMRHRFPGVYAKYRWPFVKPFERSRLVLAAPGGGLGDELMASGVAAEIKKRNPDCYLSLITRHQDFWHGGSVFDDLLEATDENRRRALSLDYGFHVPSKENVFTLITERVGLSLQTIAPKAPKTVTVKEHLQKVFGSPARPRILIQPASSSWTPNKTWPLDYWRALVKRLTSIGTVIQIGNQPTLTAEDGPILDLTGLTEEKDLPWLFSQVDIFIGPDSAGMHLAAAFQLPAVILFGGYTVPENFPYPNNLPLGTGMNCAGCWLRKPCPYDLACLKKISPEMVCEKVDEALNR